MQLRYSQFIKDNRTPPKKSSIFVSGGEASRKISIIGLIDGLWRHNLNAPVSLLMDYSAVQAK